MMADERASKEGRYQEALERIALLDEADGHTLTWEDASEAVAIAATALGKHPSQIEWPFQKAALAAAGRRDGARRQEHMNQEESKRLCDELLPQPEQILAQCKMEAAAHDMLAALLLVREIVTVAALTGFNCHEGDWAARLYASQAVTHKAVTKAGASGRTQ